MEELIIRADVTWSEIDERVNKISELAHTINDMPDRKEALAHFRVLRDSVKDDMHRLGLARNADILRNCDPLRYYHSYGDHIHYTKFNVENLNWNLDEFDEAKMWYEGADPRAYILIEGVVDKKTTVFKPAKPMNPYSVVPSNAVIQALAAGKRIQLQAPNLKTTNVTLSPANTGGSRLFVVEFN